MKTFTVRIGCEQLSAVKKFSVKASSKDCAFNKVFRRFCESYPAILTDRLTVGAAIWRGAEPRA